MNLTQIKNSLEPENIKQILSEYGVVPTREEQDHFVFPTACHNLEGGSDKLYYYFNTKLFHCFTSCGESFNIFELIQKMEALHGYQINIFEAAEKIGFGDTRERVETLEEVVSRELKQFVEVSLSQTLAPPVSYDILNEELLGALAYDEQALSAWNKEGISYDIMKKFGIKYSYKDLAIAIPHRDLDGFLIGIRGRFMAEDAPNKYMPLSVSGRLLNHSIRGNLYGLYENREQIKRSGRVILFEGEKSVLRFGSEFGQENNIALAVCGNRVTNEQVNLLVDIGIEEVVIAFDQDFQTPLERSLLVNRYIELSSKLSEYFVVSIMIDYSGLTGYKDSPIDQGKEVFEKLYLERYLVGERK